MNNAYYDMTQVQDAVNKVKESSGDKDLVIRFQDWHFKKREKIGELYGCEVWTDPYLPSDTYFIVQDAKDFDTNVV